jgi:PmbA protein
LTAGDRRGGSGGGSMLDLARRAARIARELGADEASAGAYRARNVELSWRDGKVEKVTEATTRGVGLDLYVDGRYAAVSTSDLRPEALERFVVESVALARALSPDPHRRLPDPELYRGRPEVDLELADPAYPQVDAPTRRRLAEAIEVAARAVPGAGQVRSVSTSVSDTQTEAALFHTNGFEGARRATDFWLGAEVAVQDPDGRRPEEQAATGSRFFGALETPEAVGRRAAERAHARIGAVKGASGLTTMVVEARAAGRLAGYLLGPMMAGSLQQKRSFLEGKVGQVIGSPLLDLTDDPLIPRAFGSRTYDGEGIAARPRRMVEGGVLGAYYVDTYYGRKLGLPPTTGRPSNLTWRAGAKPLATLLSDVGEGVLVTGFLGGNSNGTTGDYSLGVRGFAIRRGRQAEPIGEMNVSGSHLELWKRLAAVGDDPYPYSALRTPSLVFEGVQLAGT